jgi:hypothetical protein
MRTARALVVPIVVSLLLVGCSVQRGDGRECFEVPANLAKRIAGGSSSGTMTPASTAEVKSTAFTAYLVAMAFSDDDGATRTGVWAVTSLDAGGTILAVDDVAQSTTHWSSETGGHLFTSSEDGAVEALDCLAG